jgi:hypothetical protein
MEAGEAAHWYADAYTVLASYPVARALWERVQDLCPDLHEDHITSTNQMLGKVEVGIRHVTFGGRDVAPRCRHPFHALQSFREALASSYGVYGATDDATVQRAHHLAACLRRDIYIFSYGGWVGFPHVPSRCDSCESVTVRHLQFWNITNVLAKDLWNRGKRKWGMMAWPVMCLV